MKKRKWVIGNNDSPTAVIEEIELKGFGLSFYGHNIGIVWDTKSYPYPLHLSIFLPLMVVTIGFGRKRKSLIFTHGNPRGQTKW